MGEVWNKRILTSEQLLFLKNQLEENLTYEEITHNFNEKYPNDKFINCHSLGDYLRKNKLVFSKPKLFKIISSQKELDFVIEAMKNVNFTWKDIADEFNKAFNKNVEHRALSEHMTKIRKIKRPSGINKGKFDGYTNINKMPVGSEIEKNGYIWIKVNNKRTNDRSTRNAVYNFNWKPKHIYLWEQAHNEKLKEGEIVIFLDGNRKNFNLNNLKKISRQTNATLATYRAHNYGKTTEAMICVIEANQALKDVK
jgi:hypothetical protein